MLRFAALVAGATAFSDPSDIMPSCAVMGTAYVNAEKVKSGPDGLFVINALSCQQSCAANPDCKKFTWKRDTTPMKGGCFLISDAEAEAIEDPQATSGPKACDLGVTPGVAPSLRGSVVGISLSDGLPGAKAKAQMDRKNEKTLIAPASSPGPSDVNTFLLGLICVLSVAAAIGIIAGAAHFLLGKKKPKKSRSLKAAPEDEQPLERAPMPSTSSMSFVPSMPIQMSAPPTMAMPPTMQMSVPMAQPQPIQYYQPLQYDHYAQQFAGQA